MDSKLPPSPDEIIDIPSSPDEILELAPLQSLPPLLPGSSDFDQNDQITPPPGFPPLKPINATPISSLFQTPNESDRAGKRKKSEPKPVNKKSKPVARSLHRDLLSLASSSNLSNELKEKTEVVLLAFDALRRRLSQIADVAGDYESLHKRADMKAGAIMNANDLKANRVKRVGSIPGVEVGDIFYFRMEMCVLGLHSPVMAGIDYIKGGEHGFQGESIAVSVVSSGGYENEERSIYELIYTGEGGNARNESKRHDQKLVKGNLAMEMSGKRKNEIRVIRSDKDPFCLSNKIYIYDGLYKIQDSWVDVSKKGFRVFKYRLVREPGQPDGIAVWYKTQKWILNPLSRENVRLEDLSFGKEKLPVFVVNDTGYETDLNNVTNFKYVTTVKCENLRSSKKVLEGCICEVVCLPGNNDCKCVELNGGDLPYNLSGILVKRLNLVQECGANCTCSIDCRNRVSQKGIKFHFEVFMTSNRGWGVRSWDPIRAGSFVCEFVGEIVGKPKFDKMEFNHLNEYLFCATSVGKKALRWNRGAELAGEGEGLSRNDQYELVPVSIPVVNAKETGNFSRFLNHSCDPNLFWQLVKFGDEEGLHVMFFAIKHIPPLTELTFDYGSSTERKSKECLCGASNCRGRFG